jgi:D-alanyl-lipoteichoic acid acyltransferase DltB (MBOAT superfamily)
LPSGTAVPERSARRERFIWRVLRGLVLGLTLLFVLGALLISSALVVYTAWNHDLKEGAFALVFAVLSAQIALNWLLWKGSE